MPAERVCLEQKSTAYSRIDVPRGLFQSPRGMTCKARWFVHGKRVDFLRKDKEQQSL